MGKQEVGRQGEDLACRFLRRQGYRVLERNYRSPYGEVDIIARKGDYLVFCEVKTRMGGGMDEALAAVDKKKQGHIAKAAAHFLRSKNDGESHCRFDVIALLKSEGMWKIEHVMDAFGIGEL